MMNKVYFGLMLCGTLLYMVIGLYLDIKEDDRFEQIRKEYRERMLELSKDREELNTSLKNRTTETVSAQDLQDMLKHIGELEHEIWHFQEEAGNGGLATSRIDYIGLMLMVQLVIAATWLNEPKGQTKLEITNAKAEIKRLNDELREGLDRMNQMNDPHNGTPS